MKRNIRLGYLLALAYESNLWIPAWVLFYLRFTNYVGLSFAEWIMVLTIFLTEVPTGAVADLLGRKNTLIMAFLVMGLGNLLMGSATNFATIIMSVVGCSLGVSLFSGSLEALMFDSLKQENQEQKFDQVLANTRTISLIGAALASLLGGWLYTINPRLPFLLMGLIFLLTILPALFLVEPKIDSEKFSLANYWRQTRQGFHQLFKTPLLTRQNRLLLAAAAFGVIAFEIVIDTISVEFGFSGVSLGWLYTLTYFVAASLSQTTAWLVKTFSPSRVAFGTSALIGALFLFAVKVEYLLGGLLVLAWAGLFSIFKNSSMIALNRQTESKYRATTLSTFSMLKTLPYLLLAIPIGGLMEQFSARGVASGMGALMLVVFALLAMWNKLELKTELKAIHT